MKYINTSLVTLKCVLFAFFGGVGCLIPYLPLHLHEKGLSLSESRIISIISPLIAVLGPLVAAPLADFLAGGTRSQKRSKTGLYLRVMIAVCLIFSLLFYWLLMAVPNTIRSPTAAAFTCDERGGYVFQQKCRETDSTCYNWDEDKRGTLLVNNCRFTCKSKFEIYDYDTFETTTINDRDVSVGSVEYDDNYDERHVIDEHGGPIEVQQLPLENHTEIIPHPHICYNNGTMNLCEVYTKYSKTVGLFVSLNPQKNEEESRENDKEEEDAELNRICTYPVHHSSSIRCRIIPEVEKNLTAFKNDCIPIVKCDVHNGYNATNLLTESQCVNSTIGFWLYLFVRSLGDLFMATAVALLAAAVVIATRETSTGRGDVGKQLSVGAFGLALFSIICGAAGSYLVSMILMTILYVIAVILLLCDKNMPLSPPEWWWHTRCGLLALPMSSIKKYRAEIIALCVVLFVLGIFWGALDAYLPWRLVHINGDKLLIGLTVMLGSLLATIFLIFAEKVIDYCGHANLLIICFISYIIEYSALCIMKNANLILIYEILDVFTLYLMWTTSICYLRHLIPKKYTVIGQSIPVIFHFCLGRIFGALIGSFAYTEIDYELNFNSVHANMALACSIIAILYFCLYHFFLKTYCVPPTYPMPTPAPSVVQNMNGNGSYTPLRVYHDGMSKKGHFRY